MELLRTKFVNAANDLIDFEDIHSASKSEESVHALEVLRIELDSMWCQVKKTYITLRDAVAVGDEKPIDQNKLREHYKSVLDNYKRFLSSLNTKIHDINLREEDKKTQAEEAKRKSTENEFPSISRLPPCDTDTFRGGYSEWPTFRDLFSTLYIHNSRLSKVEKLFHLNKKTDGEAREIVRHVPLTHDGFDIAWQNLVDRYENKRMQVNEQIRLLFNLPSVSNDSGNSLKILQRTVNGCIESLKSLKISIKDWDPILIFLCSSKMPRNYLEEFEKTLHDSSNIPTWVEFDSFLTQKFKNLESVCNIRPTGQKNTQTKTEQNNRDKRVNSFQTNTRTAVGSKPTPKSKNTVHSSTTVICQFCKEDHFLSKCPRFLEKDINDRINIVKTTNSCYNCLSLDHRISNCKSKYNCRSCNQRHNSLLHKGNATQANSFTTRFDSRPRADQTLNNHKLDSRSNADQDVPNTRHDSRPSADHALTTQKFAAQPSTQAQRVAAQPSAYAQTFATTIQSTHNLESTNVTSLTLREQDNSPLSNSERETLLFTAIVEIIVDGQRHQARALIDPGSQCTFISEKLKNKLRLRTKRNLVHVSGLSSTISETSNKACIFTLCSHIDPTFYLDVFAPVLKTLPSNIPPKNFDPNMFDELLELKLADPQFHISRPVDILIGMDIGPLIYNLKVPMKSIGSLIAQSTVFGWIVGGPVILSTHSTSITSLHNTVALDKILTQFWEIEETPKTILRSEEDSFCENNYRNTTVRNDTGRFVVTLPFKNEAEIGLSRNIAMAQFLRMERTLCSKPDVKDHYDQVILEYLKLGHMRKVPITDIDKTPNYYLPHHAVIKPDRVTTKLRVVFNASCPSSNKTSLNDILYPGPILQQYLVLQTLKWRFFRYVFNADITKMYRQILLDPSQTQYQRILFRKSPKDPIEDFELLTVTFGVNCAPFLAIRTLLQLGEDVSSSHPLAATILKENMYVDDVLAGGHSLEEAVKSRRQLNEALLSAGFHLMKWSSNDPRVISDLPQESLLSMDCLHLSENLGVKTLGIKWNISSDTFSFPQPSLEIKTSYTKREVLSIIARFFDPCGWLAPVIIIAKLIMQKIWLDKIGWDEELTVQTYTTWLNFVKTCHTIEHIKVPRWIQYSPDITVEIHGFCDSSERAYCAALYIRICQNNDTHTHLLTAKTRVAPVKILSLPRLELCGAALLAKLTSSILPNLQISNYDTYFWTDSTIVLAWLKKPPCSWNTFVGNRVSQVADNVGTDNWRHVDSKDNPADIGTRGCSSEELVTHALWWNGPHWLKSPKTQWPENKPRIETNLEIKPIKTFVTTTFDDPLDRFSSLPRAYRVLSYVFRWWRNKGRQRGQTATLPKEIFAEEIKFVKERLILLTQKHFFAEEYHILHKRSTTQQDNQSSLREIPSSSHLLTLNPFLDSKGILRSSGRLAESTVFTYHEKHPIVLPYGARLSRLLVEHAHKTTLHGGNQLIIRVLRTEFWIFRLRPLVKMVIDRCKICTIFKKRAQTQIMASLPAERTTITRPFNNTGVDFAGPFNIRSFTGRACLVTKGYVCIFVCFSTKSVHLEPTSDLSTQAFLAAFARFIGRRGCPTTMHSDNGTNFVGAAEILKKDRLGFMRTLQSSVTQLYSHQNIEWKFIPPGAPHMGGLWEAGVKSFKTHLKKFVPHMNFTFEEFATILSRIESCLNSRPLSPGSDDPNDILPLTPGHFLVGTPLLTPAEPDISDENVNLVNRWKRLRIVYQSLCHRWKSEYLNELHRRYKWKHKTRNVQVNDLVVLKENNFPANEWKTGRIVKVYPGPDQNTRVVDVKTSTGIMRRPITKIVPLLID